MSAVLTAQEPSAKYLANLQPPLVQHFDLIAQAPGGVTRLRELILTLAVQGKLVPQEPSDEPASELLKKIRAEKDRLIAEGKIKRDKPLAEIGDEEKPFQIPDSWRWVRLADVVNVLNGRAYGKQGLLSEGTPVLRVGNLFTSNHWYYSNLHLEPEKYCETGDLLYAWSASFGPFIWSGPKVIYHYHIWKLAPHAKAHFDVGYFHTYLQEKTAEIKAAGHGVSMVHMTKEKMEKIVVPYPPLAEQSRIVTRVEELMQLCDALEASGQLEAKQHAQLVSTLLGTLTQSETPEALADNWQRIATHFDLLLDRPEAVDALEQTILQLAVRGLLVPQDPTDEPASVLLQKIRTEKDHLIALGKIKRDKPLSPITDEEKPFGLPQGWEWVRMGEVLDGGSGTTPLRARVDYFTDGTEMWVKTTDLNNGLVTTCEELVTKSAVAENRLKYFPVGTVCVAMYGGAGTIGKSGVLGVPSTINQSVFALPPTDGIDIDYLHSFVITVRSQWMSFAAGLRKDPNINGQIIKKMVMPLPPLTEQSRIVARVNELRSLCADLRRQVINVRAVMENLSKSLVAEV
ncbi:restriction endonuclease subunit S [Limnohabitans sp. 63ED37-2]|uniref:restriction endonuclease subunit S n=1 Tax=Limnohabitans sp. 63ED37-2 TaxID=1678128 RepID=UPI000706BB2D|nr:restriction endonuclease subunit S [Limnohabitans sp. 63ED37-2]ALK90102.1 EcoKI restriction-modification system protein HsdS [Limnohabitans sp. 63ED37-2]